MTTTAYAFELPRQVDSTMLDLARLCHQAFAFRYGYGLRAPAPAVDLHAGGAFAAARAGGYMQAARLRQTADSDVNVFQRPMDAAHAAFDAAWSDFELPADSKSKKTKPATWAAVASYFQHFGLERDALQPYPMPDGKSPFEWAFAVELTPETTGIGPWPMHPSGLPFVYAGRLDAVGLLNGTLGCGLDDKTTAKFMDATLWHAGLQMRAQFHGYVWALQRLVDPAIDSFLVRQTAIRSDGTADHRESPILQFSRHQIGRWLETTRQTLKRLVEAYRTGVWLPVLSDACTAFFRPCDFLEPCRSRDPEAQFGSFRVERWNPLSGTALEEKAT